MNMHTQGESWRGGVKRLDQHSSVSAFKDNHRLTPCLGGQMEGNTGQSKILVSSDPLQIHIRRAGCRITALLPVVPHVLTGWSTAHPEHSTQVCYDRGWPTAARITLVHVCLSVPPTCMGSEVQGSQELSFSSGSNLHSCIEAGC